MVELTTVAVPSVKMPPPSPSLAGETLPLIVESITRTSFTADSPAPVKLPPLVFPVLSTIDDRVVVIDSSERTPPPGPDDVLSLITESVIRIPACEEIAPPLLVPGLTWLSVMSEFVTSTGPSDCTPPPSPPDVMLPPVMATPSRWSCPSVAPSWASTRRRSSSPWRWSRRCRRSGVASRGRAPARRPLPHVSGYVAPACRTTVSPPTLVASFSITSRSDPASPSGMLASTGPKSAAPAGAPMPARPAAASARTATKTKRRTGTRAPPLAAPPGAARRRDRNPTSGFGRGCRDPDQSDLTRPQSGGRAQCSASGR